MRYLIFFLILLMGTGCRHAAFKASWLAAKAPEHFDVRFETSRGNFEAAFTREWSPLAVDRLYAQIRHHYYDHTLFYRVVPGYVAQFGGGDSLKAKQWATVKTPDEPVLKPNERGVISFARSGKETRDNTLFINLNNNSPRLDTILSNGVKGFPPLGKVTRGMDVVDSLYAGYGNAVFAKYDLLLSDKRAFLQQFPHLDSITRIVLIRKNSD